MSATANEVDGACVLPTKGDYKEASDGLWEALYPLEHLADVFGGFTKLDEDETERGPYPRVSATDLGELFVFLRDVKIVLGSMDDHVKKIESAMDSSLYFWHLEAAAKDAPDAS